MGLILAILLLAIIFGVLGFSLHILWVAAGILLVVWLLGFIIRGAEGSRWYRW